MLAIGYKIAVRRRALGITQRELAQKCLVPQPNLSNIEKGKQDITVLTLRRIAVALDIKMAEFFEEKEQTMDFSRDSVEALASAIVNGPLPQSKRDRQIVIAFRTLLPGKQTKGIKEVQEKWMFLRCLLSQSQIQTLQQRVYDAQTRLE